jgi:hypothetical protein
MNEEQAEELIAEVTNALWEAWVEGGGLEAVEASLGPVKSDPWLRVFEAGWKLGVSHAFRTCKLVGEQFGRDGKGRSSEL